MSFHLAHSNHADRPHYISKENLIFLQEYIFTLSLAHQIGLCCVLYLVRAGLKVKRRGSFFFCFCQSLLSAWGHGLQAPFTHFCSSPLSISSLPPYAASRSRPHMGGGNVAAGVSADLGFAWKWFTPKLQNLHLSFTVWKLFRYEVSVLLLWHFQRQYLAVNKFPAHCDLPISLGNISSSD